MRLITSVEENYCLEKLTMRHFSFLEEEANLQERSLYHLYIHNNVKISYESEKLLLHKSEKIYNKMLTDVKRVQ